MTAGAACIMSSVTGLAHLSTMQFLLIYPETHDDLSLQEFQSTHWSKDEVTYVHNSTLQPFSQDYRLAFHTTYVVCVNFTHEWRDLQFNVDSERQIFEKLFHGTFYLLSLLLKGNRQGNIFFYISFWCMTWDIKPGFTSNKPIHYLLD